MVIRLAAQVPARLVLSGTLQADALRDRVRVAAPSNTARLYLVRDRRVSQVRARGGIPSLERALGDREVSAMDAWHDTPGTSPGRSTHRSTCCAPSTAFTRSPTRRRGPPRGPSGCTSTAAPKTRASTSRSSSGPRIEDGRRSAGVRLQLERRGQVENFDGKRRDLRGRGAACAGPDHRRQPCAARRPALPHSPRPARAWRPRPDRRPVAPGVAGQLVPPIEIMGARGWRTGYVVPVMSGPLDGELNVGGRPRVARRRHRLPRPQLGILAGRVVAVGAGAARRPVVHLRPRVSAARSRRPRAHARVRRRARPRRPARLRHQT